MVPDPPRMSPVDAAWLKIEQPNNPMTITALLWFDGPVDAEALVAVVQERLVERFPRFACHVVQPALGPPWWRPDPAFDIHHHVRRTRLDGPDAHVALAEQVGEWMSGPLRRDRPPWRMDLVEGLDGGAALVVRVHHSVADGISLARVLRALADGGDERAVPLHPPRARWQERARGFSHIREHRGRGRALLTDPMRVARRLRSSAHAARELSHLLTMAPDPWTPLRRPLSGTKRCAWSTTLSLAEVKAIGRATGATVNDVVVSTWAGALGAHLRDAGGGVDVLRAFLPVDLRPLDAPLDPDLGNGFSLVIPSLPVGEPDPLRRLDAVRAEMSRLKQGTEPAVAWALLQVLGATPRGLERVIVDIFAKKASVLLTNVPGPTRPLVLAGSEVSGVQVWVPQTGQIGLGLSVFSYAGRVTVGVASDVAVLPDPSALVDRFEDAYRALQRHAEAYTTVTRPVSSDTAGAVQGEGLRDDDYSR